MRVLRLFLLIFLYPLFSFGQELTPVEWRTKITKLSDKEFMLYFEAKIDEGWNVYSQFTGEGGPVPTSINFESEGFKAIGKAEELGHRKEGPDPLFDGTNVIKFLSDQPFIIKQKIKLNDNVSTISGYLTYMTCDNEKCLPPTDVDFNFNLINEHPQELANEASAVGDKGELVPVSWEFAMQDLGSDEFMLTYRANMTPKWNVYSQYTSDEGPVPTSINYEEQDGISLIGKSVETGHKKEGADPLFDGVTVIKFLYDQPFEIKQKVKVKPGSKLQGYLTYMTCNDEGCLPPTDVDFVFDFAKAYAGAPIASGTTDGQMKLEGDVLDQAIPTIQTSLESPLGDCGGTNQTEDKGLFWSFIFGFIGGLIALLTPCVFPMIPLTVSFFTKDTKRKGWVNGMIYALSIIVIYVAMGILLTAVFGPEALNRLSTNWIANTLFFLIFLFFAFSFFGYYEITLPSSWTTKTDSMSDKGGFIGIFFMAFTLALVSFSCTGPIIGSAIVTAASNAVGPAVVMFGFSLGLALPFGLFAAFPAWLNTLPKSGGWMNSVKVVLGFLELALAFKFLSVADMTNNWGFLRYEIFMGIWVVVFAAMTLYLFGLIKFPHDSPVKKLSIPRWIFALCSFAFTIYLATGFMYNDTTKSYNALSAMSGLAPPSHYNYFLAKHEVDPTIKAKYPSYTKCANDIECFKDYYDGLAYAKENNKPVFLDFTGHGCVNCRKTEEHVWVDDEIRESLKNDFVLVSLYVDDDKKLENTLISKSRNKKMRNVGNKWADFQIVNFNQNSQPLYVMMTNDEKVMANPRSYLPNEGIEEYKEFMDCGLATFKAQK